MRKEQAEAKKLQKEQERRKRDFANFVQRVPTPPQPKPSLPMLIGEVPIEQSSLIPSVELVFSETDFVMLEVAPVVTGQRNVVRKIFDLFLSNNV